MVSGATCRDKMSVSALLLLSFGFFVGGQSLGKCPKKETMKTFDPKEVGGHSYTYLGTHHKRPAVPAVDDYCCNCMYI